MGPFTLWISYGYEGWQPTDYESLEEALAAEKYTHDWVLQKPVQYQIKETEQ